MRQALFFRDGRPYTGTVSQVVDLTQTGEALVLVYPTCGRCGGRGSQPAPWGEAECTRCNGSGHEFVGRTRRVYSSERLAELNRRRRVPTASQSALREVKAEYRQFCKQREKLIAEIETLAVCNRHLQDYYAMIEGGQVLSAKQIRHASVLVRTLRNQL